jgi:hypothetical protein
MKHCLCSDKRILSEGDGQYIANEYWCPTHGYSNSCCYCDVNNKTTEKCKYHILSVFELLGGFLCPMKW